MRSRSIPTTRETLKPDIFLDRSIIEVFSNGRQALTQIVHPEL